MIVAGHQPQILPSTRYFYKMAKADVLDIRHQAQFTSGYIHRVKMRDRWFTLPLSPKPKQYDGIDTVHVDLPKAKLMFRQNMHGRYGGSRFYKTRGLELVDKFDSLESDLLWEINVELLIYVRDQLGINTPLQLGVPAIGGKAEGVLSTLRAYPDCDTYLSGTGARNYMGDCSIFEEAGIEVVWSNHDPISDDSIVTIMMDYENPIDFVMREKVALNVAV